MLSVIALNPEARNKEVASVTVASFGKPQSTGSSRVKWMVSFEVKNLMVMYDATACVTQDLLKSTGTRSACIVGSGIVGMTPSR